MAVDAYIITMDTWQSVLRLGSLLFGRWPRRVLCVTSDLNCNVDSPSRPARTIETRYVNTVFGHPGVKIYFLNQQVLKGTKSSPHQKIAIIVVPRSKQLQNSRVVRDSLTCELGACRTRNKQNQVHLYNLSCLRKWHLSVCPSYRCMSASQHHHWFRA